MAKYNGSLFALVGAAVLTTTVATAGTVQDRIVQFGLLGTWAPNCSEPAAQGNNYGTFSLVPPDEAQESFDFGPNQRPNVYRIIFAEAVESQSNVIRLDTILNDTAHDILEITMVEGRIRTMSNIRSDGTVLVKDGVVVRTNKPTDLLSRCH